MVEGIAALTGETVAPSGAAAASTVGISTQVQVRPVFLTSGRTRRFVLGKQVVELRDAPAWQLRHPSSLAGQAARALAWLGPEGAPAALRRFKQRLPDNERQELVAAARTGVPTWLAQSISQELISAGER